MIPIIALFFFSLSAPVTPVNLLLPVTKGPCGHGNTVTSDPVSDTVQRLQDMLRCKCWNVPTPKPKPTPAPVLPPATPYTGGKNRRIA